MLGQIRTTESGNLTERSSDFLSEVTPHFYTTPPQKGEGLHDGIPVVDPSRRSPLRLVGRTVIQLHQTAGNQNAGWAPDSPLQVTEIPILDPSPQRLVCQAPLVSIDGTAKNFNQTTGIQTAESRSESPLQVTDIQLSRRPTSQENSPILGLQLPEIQLSKRPSPDEKEAFVEHKLRSLPARVSITESELSGPDTQDAAARAAAADGVAQAQPAAKEKEDAAEGSDQDISSTNNRRSWDFLGGLEEKAKQKQCPELESIKRNYADEVRKQRGEETDQDKERAKLRKDARKKREAALLERRFLHKSKVWKLNSNQTGEAQDMWRNRLLMLDGGGHLSYVSEKDAGETTRVCTVNDMLRCDVIAQPHSFCFPHVFSIGYRPPPKDKREPGAKSKLQHSQSMASKSEREMELQRAHIKRQHRRSEQATAMEKSIVFAAESEGDLKEWVKKLKVYLVQSELPSHLVMAQAMFQKTRTMVSGHRRRYVDNKFDLDLTYITGRIIAMAFPAEDSIGQFSIAIRNDLRVVKNFLDEKHPRKYKVFNLCAEKQYQPGKFDNNVEWIPFLDHNPPTLGQIKSFCYKVEKWLLLDPDNVVAVHCKGGKGRTGLMIACFLLYAGHADETPIRNIQEAIDYFADRRTDGGLAQATHPQTVTGVSQLRCVRYFDEGHRTGLQYRRIRLTKVVFTKVPDTGSTYFKPVLRVSKGTHEVYRSYHTVTRLACCARGANTNKTRWFQSGEDQMMELECTDKVLYIAADFKLELFNGNPTEEGQKLADEAVCFACLHASKTETSPLVLKQAEIDQAARDVGKHKVFPAGFEIHVHFETVEPSEDQEKRSLTFNEDQQLWFAHKMVEELEPDVFESGETVLRVGQDEDKMYLVGKGSVRMELGARVLQGTVGPLEIVAEQQLLLDNARLDGDVVANLDPTILYPIDRQTISAYFYDDVGEFYHVLCIKMVAKMVDRAAVIGNRGGVGEDGEEGEAPAKQQRHLKQIELPVNERVLEQRECWMSETGARSRGRMLLTQNYLVFKAGSLTSSTKLLKLAKVLKAEAKEQGPSLDVTITSFLPLTKEKDSNASIGLASTTCTFHLPNPGSRGMLEALQKQLDERTSFSLSWMEGEPAHPSWPFRVDEALHPLFLLAQMAQPFGGINQRQSFVRRSVGAVPRPLSFSSRTKGDEVHLSSRASISKIKNWGADSTLYVVLKGHLVVSHHQHIIARYGPGEIFGLIQFIDPSLKEVLQVTAGTHGGATLKAIPKEHLRQLLARDREFHAMFWEFGAKVLASGLRIL